MDLCALGACFRFAASVVVMLSFSCLLVSSVVCNAIAGRLILCIRSIFVLADHQLDFMRGIFVVDSIRE